MDHVSFVTNLNNESREWLFDHLEDSIFDPGQVIVVKGKKNDRIHIIEKGKIGVAIGNDFSDFISVLGSGRVAGEISFLKHNDVAGATLVAIEKSYVSHIKFEVIQSKIDEDLTFAADFYKAVGIFIARKLRKQSEL